MKRLGAAPWLLSLGAAAAACQSGAGVKEVDVAGLKSELDAQLPTGSSSADVEGYLRRNGMTHSGLIDNAKLAHMGFDPNTFELKSIVRNTKRSTFVKTDIAVTFVFDRAKRLIETRVAEVHTGP